MYRIVGYAFHRRIELSELDVTKITHLNYAFGLIYNNEYLEMNPATGEKRGSSSNTDVSTPEPVPEGKLHTVYLPNKAVNDLERLDELWAKNPDLKVLLSIGGWAARGFCDAAATEASRKVFAGSCRGIVETYGLSGIDLDWEAPVNGGWGAVKCSPHDRENFTLLLREIRAALGEDKLLTIAGVAQREFTSIWTEFQEVVDIVDYINVLSYDYRYEDYYGSALYPSKTWNSSIAGTRSADKAIHEYIKAGCPTHKINLGLALAVTIPRIVMMSPEFPEIQAKLDAAGYFTSEAPFLKRVELLENTNGFMKKWDADAQNMYISTITRDGVERFVLSYIEPTSVSAKSAYVKELGLGGVSFWEFSFDPDHLIVTQLYQELILEP